MIHPHFEMPPLLDPGARVEVTRHGPIWGTVRRFLSLFHSCCSDPNSCRSIATYEVDRDDGGRYAYDDNDLRSLTLLEELADVG